MRIYVSLNEDERMGQGKYKDKFKINKDSNYGKKIIKMKS